MLILILETIILGHHWCEEVSNVFGESEYTSYFKQEGDLKNLHNEAQNIGLSVWNCSYISTQSFLKLSDFVQ